jgi:putative heme-binding domain-containing protein
MSMMRALLVAILCYGFSQTANAQNEQSRQPWTASRLQGSPRPPEPYKLVSAFPGLRFDKPTSVEELPGEARLLITERDGRVLSFAKRTDISQADFVLDLRKLLPAELAGQAVSLLDAEPHPRYAENRLLFLSYVHPAGGGHTRLSRFKLDGATPPRAIAGSEEVILTWPSGGHNAGCLEFGADGCLYIATGDGSGPNPPDALTTGQDVSDLLGAILRIDVDRPAGAERYAIPADNPFRERPGARPEIWAYGLRNPWKFGVDPQTGRIFAADNGWETWEMVHEIVRGGNCGWPVMEGRARLRSEVEPGPTPMTPPVKDHPHTEANSVIGGPIYRGQKLPELAGAFVYGDYITGTIWAVRAEKDKAPWHQTLVDTDQRIVGFTEGSGGEVFVLDYDLTGQIYELVPSAARDNSANFPRRLSETGLFSSLADMSPAAGVVPYGVAAEPWMDGAIAQRWVAIPGEGRITLAANATEHAAYPEGTVLVKHIVLLQRGQDPIRLETQLLHYEAGVWRPYAYLWDEAGEDATLVDEGGASRPLKVADPKSASGFAERTWRVNATNECKLCHNAGPRFVLGLVPNQLEHFQIGKLIRQGVLTESSPSPEPSSRLVDPHATLLSLDDRARSYLHVNCSMCHHPGGNAIVSFFLRRDLPLEKLNTNKGTGIGTFGIPDARIIAPGEPERSILLYRMAKLGYARMPYIGSQVVDSAGVRIVDAWIRSLGVESTTIGNPYASIVRGIADADEDATERAVKRLIETTPGALTLVAEMHRGQLLDAQQLPIAVKLGTGSSSRDIRGLFETFLPESERRATLGAKFDEQVVLNAKGDLERGKLIYFSDGARCRACHEVQDRSQSLGPTLQEINRKYPRLAEVLQHVANPSLKIDDALAAYAVQTTDGRLLAGLLAEQTAAYIVLKTADKKLVRVARRDVDTMQRSAKSLMPDLLLSDLTAQEAADLLAYVISLGPAAADR